MGRDRLKKMYVGSESGYCRLCGKYQSLTKDHFPPQNTGNSGHVYIYSQSTQILSQNGMKFKTLCQECNGELLAGLDGEQKEMVVGFSTFGKDLRIYNAKYIGLMLDTHRLLRSVLGHYIGTCFGDEVQDELQRPLSYSPFYEEIRKFVLGEIEHLEIVEVYYWYYPYDETRISQFQAFMPLFAKGSMEPVFGGVVKYFPIAFWIIDKSISKLLPMVQLMTPTKEKKLLRVRADVRMDSRYPEFPDSQGATLLSSAGLMEAEKKGLTRKHP